MRNYLLLFVLTFFVTLLKAQIYSNNSVDSLPHLVDSLPHVKEGNILILPAILRYPEIDWGFGAAASYTFKTQTKDSLLRTSNIQTIAIYSLNKQVIIAGDGSVFFPHEKFILKFAASFNYFPDKFWGLGNNTLESNVEDYDYKQVYLFPQLVRKVYKKLYAGLTYEYQKVYDVSYIKNGLFDQENIEGRNGSLISGVGGTLILDDRNNAFSSSKGGFAQIYYNNFSRWVGSKSFYKNLMVDLRKYISVFRKQVLAFQAIININHGSTPIRSLSMLGGSGIMRGYYAGRYRDNNLYAIQAEYRAPLWWRFGIAGFAGFGEVSDRIKDAYLRGFKYSVGGGLRFAVKPKEKLNVRLDYGIGYKSAGYYFTIAESF